MSEIKYSTHKKRPKSDTRTVNKTAGTKRKQRENDTERSESIKNEDVEALPPTKKAKSSGSESSSDNGIDPSIAAMAPEQLAAKFTQTTLKHQPSLTPIELTDVSVPTKSFTDTKAFSSARALEHLPDFLTTYTPGSSATLQTPPRMTGTPHTLLLTTSAIRCTTLLRSVRQFGTSESKIAKLFAKHMKLAVMEKYVKDTKFGIAAGTPGRVSQLYKSGVLKADELKRVVIDGSYLDEKGRGVWSDVESWTRIVEFLNNDAIKMRLVKGETEILVF